MPQTLKDQAKDPKDAQHSQPNLQPSCSAWSRSSLGSQGMWPWHNCCLLAGQHRAWVRAGPGKLRLPGARNKKVLGDFWVEMSLAVLSRWGSTGLSPSPVSCGRTRHLQLCRQPCGGWRQPEALPGQGHEDHPGRAAAGDPHVPGGHGWHAAAEVPARPGWHLPPFLALLHCTRDGAGTTAQGLGHRGAARPGHGDGQSIPVCRAVGVRRTAGCAQGTCPGLCSPSLAEGLSRLCQTDTKFPSAPAEPAGGVFREIPKSPRVRDLGFAGAACRQGRCL